MGALASEIHKQRAILFVGAGVSGCLGLPAWRDLIRRLGEELGFRGDEFLALSTDFRALTEYCRLEKGSLDTLRQWMLREWCVDDGVLRDSRVHQLIVDLGFPLVYTTNYDHLLERAFSLHGRRFNKTINAKEQPRSYVFMPRPNPVQERILDSWGVAPIVGGDEPDESEALRGFLETLRRAVDGLARERP